ncbi:MAG: hypothetical protein JWO06_2545, partial [Bacteroidota bacterium]|nr:hypothetical protein [Bacteroidota bacterium]
MSKYCLACILIVIVNLGYAQKHSEK